MNKSVFVLGTLLAAIGLAKPAEAATGTIRYQVGGATAIDVTSEQDITINVGTVSGTVLVRISDPSLGSDGLPDDGVGKITITGSWSSGGELRILTGRLVAGDGWPASPENLLTTVGLRDLGLNSGDGIEITNAELRKHSRLAAYVSGDINGVIEVGQVQRIQCGFSTTNPTPGTINADITGLTYFAEYGADTIGRIYAGNAVHGDITALGDSTYEEGQPNFHFNIGRIVVGPGAAAAGITGDIKAEKGTIQQVYTTGPIGTSSITPKIWAGQSIQEIRAIAESTPGSVLDRDFKADIRTGLADLSMSGGGNAHTDSPLYLIRTAGDLDGAVNVSNVAWLSTGNFNWGIVVGGTINAPINIRHNLQIADIIAGSIEAPITIGVAAKGSIVATNPTGQIESVEIGFGTDINPAYDDDIRVFNGTACTPVDPDFAAPIDEYTFLDWTATVNHCQDLQNNLPFDSGSIDSVIRAAYIGSLRLASMRSIAKNYQPRVEAPEIGELEIGTIYAGVVWSGNLEFPSGTLDNDPTNDYAHIGIINIGCIGSSGDLWVDGETRIEISGDLFGQVHVPTLTSTLRIGGELGLWASQGLPCIVNSAHALTSNELEEDSPRDTIWHFADEDTLARGEIVIREEFGLTATGQIILNGENLLTGGEGWEGAVIVGDELGTGLGNRIVITADETDDEFDPDFEAPYYLAPSTTVGGGAVGLAPFKFYGTDCISPNNAIEEADGVLYTAFTTNARPVKMRWYGPILNPVGVSNPKSVLSFTVQNPLPNQECDFTISMDSIYLATLDPDGDGRTIGLGASPRPRESIYKVRYDEDALSEETFFRCDEVTGNPPVDFATDECDGTPFSYVFRVLPDCDSNLESDYAQILADPDLDMDEDGVLDNCELTNPCRCDWDGDGAIGVPDIFAFLTSWFGNQGDFDLDNDTDVSDIFAFLSCWFSSAQFDCTGD